MSLRSSAPRSIGGVLDDAIRLYRRSYSTVWPLALIATILITIPSLYMGVLLAQARTLGPQAVLAAMRQPAYWLGYTAMTVIYLLFYGALLSALHSFVEHGQASVGEALKTGTRLLPRMVLVAILFGLIVAIGFILLVVPGIYVWGIYQLVFVALIVEEGGISASFGASRRLIKGHWWRSATIVTVGFVVVLVFSLLGGVINGVAAGFFRFDPAVVFIGQSLIGAVVNVLMLPLLPSVWLIMYYDLKLRSEGGDLAARVDALAAR